jgi:hypothetical protein
LGGLGGMKDDGVGGPLSRRVPGSTRSGPSQSVRRHLSDTDVNRIQAAIDAEHANAEMTNLREPNTEPLPRVTVSGAGAKQIEKPARAAKTPRADELLRAAKALRAADELRVAESPRAAQPRRAEELASAAGRLRPEEPVLVPEPVLAPEPVRVPELVRAEEPARPPEPVMRDQPAIAPEPRPAAGLPRSTWPSGEPAPGTIGWLWPEETGMPGGSRRWQLPGRWTASGRWRYRTATLVALGAVVLAAGGLVLGISLHSSPAGTAAQAATSGLKASTHSTAKRPKGHATAPTAGGGSAAGGGSPAPRKHSTTPKRTDPAVQSRIIAGKQLLNSGKVSASAAAESDLLAGAVDSRLLLVIKAIASQEPVDVVGFADSGPGASSGAPFRLMALAETDPAASVSALAYLPTMLHVLQAHANFPAFSRVGQVTLSSGQKVVEVEYAAMSPLGG